MGWAKFDDQYTDHPKVVAAGPMAELLDMRAVIHCARYETDGFVQAVQLPRIAVGITSPKRQAAKLVEIGRWTEVDGGWMVHDFLDYHPSKSEKDEEREKARERMASARKNKRKNKVRSSGEHPPNEQENNARSSGNPDPAPPLVPNGTTTPVGDGKPSFATRLADEFRSDGWEPPDGASLYQSFHALLNEALERKPQPEHRNVTMGLIACYVEKAGVTFTSEARDHTARLVGNYPASEVLRAWGEAVKWGAGIGDKHSADPKSMSKYATSVLTGKAA